MNKETQTVNPSNNIVLIANQKQSEKSKPKSKMIKKQIKNIPFSEPNIHQKWRMYKEIDEPYMLRDIIPKEEDEFIKQFREAIGGTQRTQEELELESIMKAEQRGKAKIGTVYSLGEEKESIAPVSMKTAKDYMIERIAKSRSKVGSDFYDDSKSDLSDLYKSEIFRSSQIVGSIQKTPEQIANEMKSLKEFSPVKVSSRGDISDNVRQQYEDAVRNRTGTQQLRDITKNYIERKRWEKEAKKDLMMAVELRRKEREEEEALFNKQMAESLRQSRVQNEASRLLQATVKRKLYSDIYNRELKQKKSIQKSFSVLDIQYNIREQKEKGLGMLLSKKDLFDVPESKPLTFFNPEKSESPAKRGRGRPKGSINKNYPQGSINVFGPNLP